MTLLLLLHLAAAVVCLLVLRGTFHRVEHLLMALAAVFVAYVAAGLMVGPDWARAAEGLLVPTAPVDRIPTVRAATRRAPRLPAFHAASGGRGHVAQSWNGVTSTT